jgi:hypothetical protein
MGMTYVKAAAACLVAGLLVGFGTEWRQARAGGPPASWADGLGMGLAMALGLAVVVCVGVLRHRQRATLHRRWRERRHEQRAA